MLNEINYQIYRGKYNFGQYLNLKAPVDISLELSSACNLACGYCYHADKKNLPFKIGFMDKDIAKGIIHEAASLGVNSLKFNWKGESTLNPHYTEITKYAKDLARGGTFIDRLANTNFQILPKIREDRFVGLASLTKVKISYDSFIADVFEAQRYKGKHALITENIDLFYNHPERIKSETQMVIQAVRTLKNKDEDIYHETKKRWPDAEISIRDMVAGRVETDVSEFENKERDFSERKPCKQAFVRLIFNHEGIALPCCPDIKEKLVLGTYPKTSVKQIFNSGQAKRLRERLKSGVAFKLKGGTCKGCSSFETFKNHKGNWDS